MDCTSCGGLLPAKSNICTYCGRLNETDLRGLARSAKQGEQTPLSCPRCEHKLFSLDLLINGSFIVERCGSCFGIFFDPGELELLVDSSVSHVYEVDFTKLNTLLAEEGEPCNWPVAYLNCPACSKHMNRKSYGSRSGVIADSCKECGLWLDGGELRKVLNWAKAGGRIHTNGLAEERERLKRLADMSQDLNHYQQETRHEWRSSSGGSGEEVFFEVFSMMFSEND